MAQQINLYRPELRPQKLAFSARFTLATGVGVALLCLLLSIYTQWQIARATEAYAAAEADLTAWQARSAQMQAQLSAIRNDTSLQKDSLEAQRQIAALRRVSAHLEQAKNRPEHGYAEYLAALARGTTQGVWLTRVNIAGHGQDLAISGAALQPRLLPGFIHALGAEDAFAQRQFQTLRIERETGPADQVVFHLSTREAEPQ